MKVYRTDEIRNVVLLGHGGSGKTSLAEAMLYVSGATNRMGKISESNTVSDFDKEEQKRGFSISTSLVPIEWEKAKINILDTPGYFDFVGEVEEAVSAADAAVIVVSGKAGVQVGTEKAWELCDKYNLPRMIYVTEMDVDDASFRQVVADLTERYGKKIAPHFQPIRENEKLVGYINIIKNAGRRYTGIGQREECEIPDYCMPNLEILRDSLMEAVAETSEEFMERYFNGDITLLNERTEGGERIADVLVRTSRLHGTTIEGDIIPTLIDEIPVIAVMAAVAEGTTVIKDAAELKVKETDRIETVTDNLKAMGCDVTPTEDGMIINGGRPLHGASIHTLLDHRIAMAFSIAALVAEGTTKILDSKCVDVSYPTFYDTFEQLL